MFKFIAVNKLGLWQFGLEGCFIRVKYRLMFVMANYFLKNCFPEDVIWRECWWKGLL